MVPIPTRRRMPCAVSSLLFTMLLVAQAQAQSPTTNRPDPLDPKAQVPSVRYESSFAQFRRIGDDKPLAWREANDAVARIGGCAAGPGLRDEPASVFPRTGGLWPCCSAVVLGG
jgi:hypothetical protein